MERRLVANVSPSLWKLRFDIEHAISIYETLGHKPDLAEARVKAVLNDLLLYLSNFEEANRFVIFRCSRVEDDGQELHLDVDVDDLSHVISAPASGGLALKAIK